MKKRMMMKKRRKRRMKKRRSSTSPKGVLPPITGGWDFEKKISHVSTRSKG